MKAEIEKLMDEILRPLLAVDGGEIVLLEVGEAEIRLYLGGALRGAPESQLVKGRVIEPALRTVIGDEVSIVYSSSPNAAKKS